MPIPRWFQHGRLSLFPRKIEQSEIKTKPWSVCTALPSTLLGPCTCITLGLLGDSNAMKSRDRPTPVMGQLCWELLHPFPQHWQHGRMRNNSQQSWPNYVGSWCVRFHLALILCLWNEREILGTKCRCVAIDFVVDFVKSLGYAR